MHDDAQQIRGPLATPFRIRRPFGSDKTVEQMLETYISVHLISCSANSTRPRDHLSGRRLAAGRGAVVGCPPMPRFVPVGLFFSSS
jgi:hypothetical protein